MTEIKTFDSTLSTSHATVGAWAQRKMCGCTWMQLGQGVVVFPCGKHQPMVMQAIETVTE